MKKTLLLQITLSVCTYATAQHIEIFKSNNNQPVSNQSLIYALPQTSLMITVEVTKTIILKGPYADFADKYLKLLDVPMNDSQAWSVSDITIKPLTEADPSQYYTITFKTFPEKLNHFFSLSNNGFILDFANVWQSMLNKNISNAPANEVFDPCIIDETIKEKVDTFYKTVLTDSTFSRIPVFKKEINAKTTEDIAKEAAHELIKTRKRKIKMLRGEFDFHPDGVALKVMVAELEKYEETLLAMFVGNRLTEKQHYTYTLTPQPDALSKELCYFNPAKGIQNQKGPGCSTISIQITREQEPNKSIIPEKEKNVLYIRAPLMATVVVSLDDKNIASLRVPIYQFGPVQIMPLK
jgi:hypothetical protein